MTDRATEFGVTIPDSPSPSRAAEFGVILPEAPAKPSGAFFGIAQMLPESVQKRLPSLFTGPSVGEQLTGEQERVSAEEKRLARPLTLKERLDLNPAIDSPVAMGFATQQIGEAPAIGGAISDKAIDRSFSRAVKPTVAGKGTASAVQDYFGRARNAISSIIDNKSNLQLTDSSGNQVSGELPKSLEQFSEAIEQTKAEIFKKYDAMAKQAAAGAPPGSAVTPSVSLMPAVNELTKIANYQEVQDLRPELADYATARAKSLSSRGVYSITEAQRAVQNLNQSLKAFYKNPSYETASRASIDALIANQLRSALDTSITNAVGPGYQELKNQYGSLKTIENDVVKRAQIVARQEAGGGILGRIADVASAEEVLRGIVTLSPAAVARGVGTKVWAQSVKYLRDPNRAIEKIFDAVEKRQSPTPAARPIVPSIPISPIFPNQQDPATQAMGLQ